MPIVLDDSILIPPSLRRGPPPRVYNVVQPGTTTTTVIESGVSHIPHRPLTPPRSPVFIHQETTSYMPPQEDLGEFRGEVEYVSPGSRRRVYIGSDSERSSRYRSRSIGATHEGGFEVSQRRRNYGDDEEYNHRHHSPHVVPASHRHEDYPGPHESERPHRRGRQLPQAELATGALGAANEIHDHRGRRRIEDESSSDTDGGHGHHRGRKVAAAALGATAAGAAAHHMYKRRHRSRARSYDSYTSYTSSSDTGHHTGRKVAGAALGATAASIAAHKIQQHRRKSRSSSAESRSPSSNRAHPHHRKAKLAAAALGTGLAARHLHHRRKARSKSSSRSRSREREPWGRHLAAAALGATAAGLAHHEYNHHHQPERPRPVMRRSYSDGGFKGHRHGILSRNHSPPSHKHSKLKKAAATAVAAAVAKKAIDHYREGGGRSRSGSRSSSSSHERRHGPFHRGHSRPRSRSKPRHQIGVPEAVAATMIGAGIAGERAHKKHKEKKREQEMHGRGVAVPAGEPHPMHHDTSHLYARPGGSLNDGGYAETIDSDTTTSIPRDNTPPPQVRNRSRKASLSARFADGLADHHAGAPDQRRTLGDGLSPEAIAYKLGQTTGEHTNNTGKH
ncbi:hypothetical protein EV426DRAFT_607115 [Tirmania nivea]|nr:hypothetical protein EV426DRAFT_607115 [Tirmania nivea]